MLTIDQIVHHLCFRDKQFLRAAFRAEIQNQFIEYEPGKFIGVYINHPHLHIEQKAGFWSAGTLTGHVLPFIQPVSIAYQEFDTDFSNQG
jgi:hypothetical protein